ADPIVVVVGDVEAPVRGDLHALREVEPGVRGRAAVTAVALVAVPGDGGHDSRVDVDAADAGVGGVGHVDVAGRVGGDAVGGVEPGQGGRPAIAAVPPGARPADRGDDAVGVDPADAIVLG